MDHSFSPASWSKEAGGMTVIYKDHSFVLLSQLADLPKRGNVTVHGECPICGHQPQPMLLQGDKGRGQAWEAPTLLFPAPLGNRGTNLAGQGWGSPSKGSSHVCAEEEGGWLGSESQEQQDNRSRQH